jgi:hypothetical protein
MKWGQIRTMKRVCRQRFSQHSSINDLTPKEFIILHENNPETLTSVAYKLGGVIALKTLV